MTLSLVPVVTGVPLMTASEFLRPLRLLDLPRVYATNNILVDLLVYLILFNGLSQSALHRRLPGRGGRLVAGAIGTGLALALSILESQTGFSLASLGPIAVLLILGLLGGILYRTIKGLGVSALVAGALTCVVLVFSLEAMGPALAGRMESAFPFLHLVLAVAVGTLLWSLAVQLLPRDSSGKIQRVARQLKSPAGMPRAGTVREPAGSGLERERKLKEEVRKETPAIASTLRRVVRRERKESRAILRELTLIRELLREGNLGDKERRELAEALHRIPAKRHRLHELVEQVRALDRNLERFDLQELQELRKAMESVAASERPLIRRLVAEERKKVRSEERIRFLEGFIQTYDTNGAKSVETAASLVVDGKVQDALVWIDTAIRYEEEARRMIKRAQALQRMLLRICRLEFRQLKRVA